MTRTDVHSPKNLVTEDYEFVGCGSYGTATEPGYSPVGPNGPGAHLIDEGWRFAENHSAGGCYHCGAHMRYYAVLMHMPTKTLIKVGETCLDNRFERSSAEFHELRKKAQLDREQQRIVKAKQAWFAEDEDRLIAFTWATDRVNEGDYGWEGFRHNFVHKINRYGSTTDKFVAAIMRDMERTLKFEAEREQRKAEDAATATPVLTGKVFVEGVILSKKWRESDYGGAFKIVVKDDRGFKVWGTLPSACEDAARGDRIEFRCTVTASDDDPTFGFFKRPTQSNYYPADEAENGVAA